LSEVTRFLPNAGLVIESRHADTALKSQPLPAASPLQ
jgi:hypothetical protein